jgi:lipopolysaccharide export system permease protein
VIIFRYLSKEVFNYFMAATILLLAVFVSNRLLHYLNIVDSGMLAAKALGYIVLLQIPHLLALLLPGSLFFGMLFAYGRLYLDSEMTALFACGFTRAKLVQITIFLGLMGSLLVALLMFWVNPMAQYQMDRLASNKTFSSLLFTLRPGQFQPLRSDGSVIFANTVANDHSSLTGLFMARAPQGGSQDWTILSADAAHKETRDGDRYVVAENGYQYQGSPGDDAMQVVRFHDYGLRVAIPEDHTPITDRKDFSMDQLFALAPHDLEAKAELQWRFSIPIATFILALMAVPLSRANPRQGKYSQLLPSLLVYIFYLNMLLIGASWLQQGKLSPNIGLWGFHGVMFLLMLSFYWFQGRGFRSRIRRAAS